MSVPPLMDGLVCGIDKLLSLLFREGVHVGTDSEGVESLDGVVMSWGALIFGRVVAVFFFRREMMPFVFSSDIVMIITALVKTTDYLGEYGRVRRQVVVMSAPLRVIRYL